MTPETLSQALQGIPDDRQRAILSLLAAVHPKPLTRLQIGDSVWHFHAPLNAYVHIRSAVTALNRHLSLFGWHVAADTPSGANYTVEPLTYRLERIAA